VDEALRDGGGVEPALPENKAAIPTLRSAILKRKTENGCS